MNSDKSKREEINALKKNETWNLTTLPAGKNVIDSNDSDYATDKDTRKSTTGYISKLRNAAVTWSSKRQHAVTFPTTEAEYVAACQATKEAIWIRRLMNDIGESVSMATPPNSDDQSAIKLIHDPEFHNRTKHVDIQFRFMREKFQDGEIEPVYVSTKQREADLLTRVLPRTSFLNLRNLIGMKKKNEINEKFHPKRIPILKISFKSDTYALDTPGRKLDPAARESVLSGICSLPRADLLEILNTLFLSLGDDIARIPALNNFIIAKVEERVQQNTINEPSGKRVKKEQFPSLPPTKGNPLQSSVTVQRKRPCRLVGVQDVESCRTYNVDVSNKFESIANVDDTDMRMDENYSPGADLSLHCMPGPSHEEIQIPNKKPRESKIISNNDEQMDNNEDQRHMQEARKQQVPPITVRNKTLKVIINLLPEIAKIKYEWKDSDVPVTFEQVKSHPYRKQWESAMKDGIQSLYENETETLVPIPEESGIVDCRGFFYY
ncbi:hypothetical protein JTB14_027871 [Gonioctena quinquepunctata]|nr:hypothetical protein JTB14_027871 [Gonioctena quinquepunctata]